MLKHLKILMIVSMFVLIMLPTVIATENETIMTENTDISIASSDYYFDSSLENDNGNGSVDNPYKYLTDSRIFDNSNIHLAPGEYDFAPEKTHSSISIYGKNSVIKGNGNLFTVEKTFFISNVTLVNTPILNQAIFTASNVVFCNSTAPVEKQNYDNSFGGAITCSNSNSPIYLENCRFENTSAEYGGAIYCERASINIKNTEFYNCWGSNYGGAITCFNSQNITISKSKFIKCYSNGDAGGAIYIISSTINVKDTDFINCNATFGGAITSISSSIYANNCNFTNNNAKWEGGSIYHIYGNVLINSSYFKNNTARNGGALFIDNSTSATTTYNNFTQNSANICAGAVYSLFNSLTSPLNATNLFKDNFAYMYDDYYDSVTLDLEIGNGNYTLYHLNSTEYDSLPSKYSLIDEGQVTVAKDQQSGGSCWAFAGIAVLESAILKSTGQTMDLSEENMKNLMAKYSNYGWDMEVNSGGYMSMIYGYLTSWLGPVNDSSDKYDDKSAISQVMNSIMHVQNILIPTRSNYTDNDEIKWALIKYGAVGTSMYMGGYMNYKTYAYYCNSNSVRANHAVTIVGWDDNYSKNNFATKPEGDGAWIVKNSWGPNWGKNGYFYVSYYDTIFAQPGSSNMFAIILNDTIRFDKNYQYDIAGKTDIFLNSTSKVWYKNIFTATDDEYLAAISTYFDKLSNWTVTVKVNNEFMMVKSGISPSGYFTINLDQLIPLKKGDVFEIIFNITVSGEGSFPISEAVSLNKQTYTPGISFASWDGENWVDIYNLAFTYSTHWYTSQVACIKAFTVLNEINTTTRLTYLTYGNILNITARVVDEYGNELKSGNVTFFINSDKYSVLVKNGIAKLTCPLNKTSNKITAFFKSPGYNSSKDNTSLNISKKDIELNLEIIKIQNNLTVSISASENINDSIILKINNKTTVIHIKNGIVYLNLTNLNNDIYNISAAFLKDSLFRGYDSKIISIDMKNTEFISEDMNITDDNMSDFHFILVDERGIVLPSKDVSVVLNNVSKNYTTDTSGCIYVPIDLNCGNYAIEMNYQGDDEYFKSYKTNKINIKTKVEINLKATENISNIDIDITLSKNITEYATLTVNGKNQTITITNGNAKITLSNLKNGEYNIRVSLNKNKYEYDDVKTSILINLTQSKIISKDIITYENNLVNFTAQLLDANDTAITNEKICFIINNSSQYAFTDELGYAAILLNLSKGNYTIISKFNGDNTYLNSNASNIITIKNRIPLLLTVEAENILFGEATNIYISFDKNITDTVEVIVNNHTYFILINEGKGRFAITNLDVGNYTVNVSYNGSNSYVSCKNSTGFSVNKHESIISIIIDNEKLGKDTQINIEIPNAYGNVILTVDNITANLTLINGKANYTIHNITSGNHKITAVYSGDSHLKPSNLTKIITVEKYVSKITDIAFNNDGTVNAILTNENDDIIANVKIAYSVNGIQYSTITDNTGKMTLNASSPYKIWIYYGGDDENLNLNSTITLNITLNKLSTNIIGENYTQSAIEYSAGERGGYFKVKLVDANGRVLANKSVLIGYNGKILERITDNNGYASVQINLKDTNRLTFAVTFLGDDKYLASTSVYLITITKKPITITATSKTYKVSSKSKKFTVTLKTIKSKDGKTYFASGKKITLKINGKTYTGKTNSNGQVNFNIKLTKKGTYTSIIKYLGDSTYSQASKTVKIKIK